MAGNVIVFKLVARPHPLLQPHQLLWTNARMCLEVRGCMPSGACACKNLGTTLASAIFGRPDKCPVISRQTTPYD